MDGESDMLVMVAHVSAGSKGTKGVAVEGEGRPMEVSNHSAAAAAAAAAFPRSTRTYCSPRFLEASD